MWVTSTLVSGSSGSSGVTHFQNVIKENVIALCIYKSLKYAFLQQYTVNLMVKLFATRLIFVTFKIDEKFLTVA